MLLEDESHSELIVTTECMLVPFTRYGHCSGTHHGLTSLSAYLLPLLYGHYTGQPALASTPN